jgi:N-acyl-D-amino-acid deacylase
VEPDPDAGAPLDLLIHGGSIVDGSGERPAFAADIGVRGDRIVAVGPLGRDGGPPARRSIDATGRVVCPGFIDSHTHVESAILAERDDALGPVRMGVTTVLTAPDGFGWAPLSSSEARDLWRGTAGIHGPMPPTMSTPSPEAYLAGFIGRSTVNVLPQAPLGAIRFAAMGWKSGPAPRRAFDRMRGHLEAWLDAGATGVQLPLPVVGEADL